jgi:hypothetical protein
MDECLSGLDPGVGGLVGMRHPVQNGSNKAGVRTGSGRQEM